MSFSTELKEEISKTENLSDKEAVKYELLGYLMSSNISEKDNKIKYSTENEYNINRFSRILSNSNIDDYDISIQGKMFTITCPKIKIQTENLPKEQIKNVIRGAYLGSGSINNPENTYHLEIGIRRKEYANLIIKGLNEYDIKCNCIEKNKEYTIYLKDGEEISKILALLGANKSVLKFEEIRVQREMKNKINRIVNCETANMNKTMNAAIEQIDAIRKLKENGKFEKMEKTLKEIAELRIQNPSASLTELGKMLQPPISKSGVNYRLKKIMEIGKE
mgnify:FL=1